MKRSGPNFRFIYIFFSLKTLTVFYLFHFSWMSCSFEACLNQGIGISSFETELTFKL